MRNKLKRLLEISMGCSLLLFGLNGFFHFIPLPEKHGYALQFMTILQQSLYLFPTVSIIQLAVGLALLSNRAIFPALLFSLPVTYNIAAFHLLHDSAGIAIAVTLFSINLWLIGERRQQLKQLFSLSGV